MKILNKEIITENGVEYEQTTYAKHKTKHRITPIPKSLDTKTLELNEEYTKLINQNIILGNDVEVDRLRDEYTVKLSELVGD